MGVKRKHSFGSVIFVLLSIVSAAALLISYLALFLNPAGHPVVMFLGLYFIPILLFNLLLLIIALFKNRRALLVLIVAILPTLLLADRFVKFGREEEEPRQDGIKMLTYNLTVR